MWALMMDPKSVGPQSGGLEMGGGGLWGLGGEVGEEWEWGGNGNRDGVGMGMDGNGWE